MVIKRTDTESIKKIYSDLIEGKHWKCRPCKIADDMVIEYTGEWETVHLGDGIKENYEYQPQDSWVVERVNNEPGNYTIKDFDINSHSKYYFKGTYDECCIWIKNHTGAWYTRMLHSCDQNYINGAKDAIVHILKECNEMDRRDNDEYSCAARIRLEGIVTELGLKDLIRLAKES